MWTFYLRDAKWENGESVTANDFKFSWLRTLKDNSDSNYSYILFPIKGAKAYNEGKAKAEDVGIKVINERILEVTLDQPAMYLDSLVSFPIFVPLNEKYYKNSGNYYGTDVGYIMANGAYKLVKWDHDNELKLVKNEKYWNSSKIKIKNIKGKFYDTSSILEEFKNGELDLTFIYEDQDEELKNDKRLTVYDGNSVWYLEYNLKNKFLCNKKIRQALTMAVDKKELAEILYPSAKAAYGFVPDSIIGVDKSFREESGEAFPVFNPEKARKLFLEGMKELGMEKVPKITLVYNDAANNRKIVEYVQWALKNELNYEIELESVSFKTKILKMIQSDFDIVLAGWGGDYNDASSYMDLWVTNGGNNHTSYANPKYDRLIEIAQTSLNQK